MKQNSQIAIVVLLLLLLTRAGKADDHKSGKSDDGLAAAGHGQPGISGQKEPHGLPAGLPAFIAAILIFIAGLCVSFFLCLCEAFFKCLFDHLWRWQRAAQRNRNGQQGEQMEMDQMNFIGKKGSAGLPNDVPGISGQKGTPCAPCLSCQESVPGMNGPKGKADANCQKKKMKFAADSEQMAMPSTKQFLNDGELENLTSGHVKEALEHAYPNSVTEEELAVSLRCTLDEIKGFLAILEKEEQVECSSNQTGKWIRKAHESAVSVLHEFGENAQQVVQPQIAGKSYIATPEEISLEREIELHARLPVHPNIAKGKGCVVEVGSESIRGLLMDELDEVVLAEGTHNTEKLLAHALAGLKACHDKGIVHGDIIEENIMRDKSGNYMTTLCAHFFIPRIHFVYGIR